MSLSSRTQNGSCRRARTEAAALGASYAAASHYEMLKCYGFSPAKAAEICLDAERGNPYAAAWLFMAWLAWPTN